MVALVLLGALLFAAGAPAYASPTPSPPPGCAKPQSHCVYDGTRWHHPVDDVTIDRSVGYVELAGVFGGFTALLIGAGVVERVRANRRRRRT